MALVDVKCTLIIVDVGAYSKSSDGGLFTRSILGKSLEPGTLNIPSFKTQLNSEDIMCHVGVSDESFPIQRDLLRPYCGVPVHNDENKQIYNRSLSRACHILTPKYRLFFCLNLTEFWERR